MIRKFSLFGIYSESIPKFTPSPESLIELINRAISGVMNSQQRARRSSIISKIEKNPLKIVKTMTSLSKVEITHVLDYESNEAVHTDRFIETLRHFGVL